MSEEELEFVKWYRKFFKCEQDLPCLECSDFRIVICSKSESDKCSKFRFYLRKVDRK